MSVCVLVRLLLLQGGGCVGGCGLVPVLEGVWLRGEVGQLANGIGRGGGAPRQGVRRIPRSVGCSGSKHLHAPMISSVRCQHGSVHDNRNMVVA